MRLTCPNCLAQYEIDGDLLPPDGREVQCSACDSIWFQSAPPRKTAKAAGQRGSVPLPSDNMTSAPRSWLDDVSPAGGDDSTDTDTIAPNDDLTEAPPSEARNTDSPRPRARSLDPSVTDVLRQEAEFEAAQRKRDADPVEMQPDLGLLGGNPWPAFRDPDDADLNSKAATDTSAAPNANFPDIDDVSATLEPLQATRQSDAVGYDLPMTAQERQRSFLQGFIVPVALGSLFLGLYMAAPLLSVVIPPAAPVFNGYVTAIDTGRAALAAMVLGR